MLTVTKASQPVVIRLSELTGLPRHKVRYSLRLLEKDRLIAATQENARVTDLYNEFMNEIIAKAEGIRGQVRKGLTFYTARI